MHQNGYSIMLDVSSKFFFYIFIRGWYQHAGDKLEAVQLKADGVRLPRADVKPGYPGLPADEGFQEWNVQCLMDEEIFPSASEITFVTRSGREVVLKLADLVVEREMLNSSAKLDTRFFEEIAREPFKRVLDLGGRDRSKRGLSYFLDRHEVTVFDIHPAPGVDVVGDAHELSSHFPDGHFDAVHCRSVLEHIAMPWKLVIEVARVLRPGGVGIFHTHQTVGMHDLPWDFWRFSDSAWDALFNAATGFRVVDRALAYECFIIPMRWRPGVEYEKAGGFEASSVMVEKVGEPTVSWPVRMKDILTSSYPLD